MPSPEEIFAPSLLALEEKHRLRKRKSCNALEGAWVQVEGKKLLSFASNDYFGLAQHPDILEINSSLGAGASALVSGYHPALRELEAAIAQFKEKESCLIFSSGYLANIGTIPALVGKEDLILADKLSHACLIDGAKLSGATLRRFKHNDLAHLSTLLQQRAQYRRCLIVTETVFSMDGDRAPLKEIDALARDHDAWLLTDDAHGLGIIHDNPAIIQMGTLSKGLGTLGGYVCGSGIFIEQLVNSARSYIFTTALPSAVCLAAKKGLELLSSNPAMRRKPIQSAQYFTQSMGLPEAQSPIVPLIMGSDDAAVKAAGELMQAGFWVPAIRPPTVPEGSARLRFAFSSLHEQTDIERLIDVLKVNKLG
jgi:8-amino-7-oxononanoate synthase